MARKVLVTGGQRSGKSRYAEALLAGEPHVTYVAPGPAPDPARDPDWCDRVATHRSRRPEGWSTLETAAVADALPGSTPPVLLDCLGTWVAAVVDGMGVWDVPPARWRARFEWEVEALVAAWAAVDGLGVAVTNEVGWGLVSEHRSGRVFTDLLGRVNQEFAAVSDDVVLMVAGRPLHL